MVLLIFFAIVIVMAAILGAHLDDLKGKVTVISIDVAMCIGFIIYMVSGCNTQSEQYKVLSVGTTDGGLVSVLVEADDGSLDVLAMNPKKVHITRTSEKNIAEVKVQKWTNINTRCELRIADDSVFTEQVQK